jgi:hypothetical protein
MLTTDLIKLNNLHLAGKLVSEELVLGVQTSRRSGAGTEFEQFRHYVAGDDPSASTGNGSPKPINTSCGNQLLRATSKLGYCSIYRGQ